MASHLFLYLLSFLILYLYRISIKNPIFTITIIVHFLQKKLHNPLKKKPALPSKTQRISTVETSQEKSDTIQGTGVYIFSQF